MLNVSKLYCDISGDSDQLRYNDNSGKPVVVFNCTSRCNLKCSHCYSNSGSVAKGEELSTSQAKSLIDDISAFGCPVLLFSGGEPLIRHDLFELLEHAQAKDLRTVLSSNGTLINEDAAKKLFNAKIGYVGVSLDGDKDFHDEFRGQSGCFEAALKGIENCRKFDIKTGLRFTITKFNLQYVPMIFVLAAKAGVRRLCFYHLIPAGRAVQYDASPTPAQNRQVLDVIFEKTSEYVRKGLLDEVLTVGNHVDGPYLLLTMMKNGKDTKTAVELLRRNQKNRSGEMIACVNWDGEVFADQFWRNHSLGNVTQRQFSEIWSDTSEPVLAKLRTKVKSMESQCLSCAWFDVCHGNYRFTGKDADIANWHNVPGCYLTQEEKSLKGD